MVCIFLRKTVMILFAILKWISRAALEALKLVFRMAKLFLLLFVLAAGCVSEITGVTAGRR